MSSQATLSFVIPVYNEEHSLTALVDAIQTAMKSQHYATELVFIDDGSTDASPKILTELQQTSALNIKVITFRKNFGKLLPNPT